MTYMSTRDEKIVELLSAASHTDQLHARRQLVAKAEQVMETVPHKTLVFVTPGGAFGDNAMLFSSITNAAYFLLRHTKDAWTRTCRNTISCEYKEANLISQLIIRRCSDLGGKWSETWWFAKDGCDDHVTDMASYNIIDMRSYSYKDE